MAYEGIPGIRVERCKQEGCDQVVLHASETRQYCSKHSIDAYQEAKLEQQGYPGLPSTSQEEYMKANLDKPSMYGLAANDPKGRHICDWCNNPYNPAAIHDCYEKRNGIKLGGNSVDIKKAAEILTEPMVSIEQCGNKHVNYEILNIPNDQAMRIIQDVLPKALELYLKKSKDYGGNVMDRFDLGQKAAIPDMARKFGKLIDAIWRDQPLQFEQPDEILMDLLGHILIVLDERRP